MDWFNRILEKGERNMKLTNDQVAQYERDGYLRYGELLTAGEVKDLRKRLDEHFTAEFEDPRVAWAHSGRRHIELRAGEEGENKTSVQQIVDLYKIDPAFEALVNDPRILDVTESLIGPNIQVLADQALLKPAYHGGELPWHQDNAYFKLDPPKSVTCWIAFADVTEENSPLRFLPGSHSGGLVEHGSEFQGTILQHLEVDDSQAVTVTLPAGHASWHHCEILHNTKPNTSPYPRPGYAIQFISAECRSNSGDEARNDELRTRPVVRGSL